MPQTPQERFIETMGLIAQAEGASRISGQIIGYLAMQGQARSLTEIATDLGVSKASVSTNVRMLEAKGTAIKESRRGSRQDLWRVVAKPHHRVLTSMAERFLRNAAQIDEIAGSFPGDQAAQQDKVAEFADFYRQSAEFLTAWATTLDDKPIGSPAASGAKKSE